MITSIRDNCIELCDILHDNNISLFVITKGRFESQYFPTESVCKQDIHMHISMITFMKYLKFDFHKIIYIAVSLLL